MTDHTKTSYTREELNSTKRVDLRKLASSFKVSGIRTKTKEQLINDILQNQQQQQQPSNAIKQTSKATKTTPLRLLKHNEKYTRDELTNSKRDVLRPLASSFKVSNIRNKNKEQLINAILQNQDNPPVKTVSKPSSKTSIIHDLDLTLETKFNDKIRTYSYSPSEKSHSLEDTVNFLYSKLKHLTSEFVNYKVSIDLKVTFKSEKYGNMQHFINSKRYTKLERPSKDEILNDLQHKIDSKDTEGSGWVIESIDKAYLNITKFSPLNGSSFRELPDNIKKKQAVLNIRNDDDKCFLVLYFSVSLSS